MDADTKETKPEKPDWLKMKPSDVEKLIIELGRQGNPPEKIGLILRDKHGIPKAKLITKKISMVLKENKIGIKSAKDSASERSEQLKKHIAQNKHDNTAKKALTKRLWIINKATQ